MQLRLRTSAFVAVLAATTSPSFAFQSTHLSQTLHSRTSLSYSTWDAFEMPDNVELMIGGVVGMGGAWA
jgi:hypothetical protein